MYSPKHFNMDDPSVLRDLIRAHPLATVVQNTAEGLQANHIPVQLVEVGGVWCLRGHVARANPLWQDALVSPEVLLVFSGVSGYVSPNWYPSKAVDGRAVPTWNYAVVHVRGVLSVHEDGVWLREALADLTAAHEAQVGVVGSPVWRLEDAPEDYLAAMLRAVVGIEVRVDSMQGKFKMSQNQSEQNRSGVLAGLLAQSSVVEVDGLDLAEQGAGSAADLMSCIRACAPK